MEVWSDHHLQLLYWAATIASNYLIPCCLIVVQYALVSRLLCARRAPGVLTPAQERVYDRRNRKTHLLMALCTASYAVSWLPVHLYWIMEFVDKIKRSDASTKFIDPYYQDVLYIAVHWLAVASVCYNPFLYA